MELEVAAQDLGDRVRRLAGELALVPVHRQESDETHRVKDEERRERVGDGDAALRGLGRPDGARGGWHAPEPADPAPEEVAESGDVRRMHSVGRARDRQVVRRQVARVRAYACPRHRAPRRPTSPGPGGGKGCRRRPRTVPEALGRRGPRAEAVAGARLSDVLGHLERRGPAVRERREVARVQEVLRLGPEERDGARPRRRARRAAHDIPVRPRRPVEDRQDLVDRGREPRRPPRAPRADRRRRARVELLPLLSRGRVVAALLELEACGARGGRLSSRSTRRGSLSLSRRRAPGGALFVLRPPMLSVTTRRGGARPLSGETFRANRIHRSLVRCVGRVC